MKSQSFELDFPLKPRPLGGADTDGTRPGLRLCVSVVRVEQSLRPPILQRSIEVVMRRHDALRTRIVHNNGAPYQQIAPFVASAFSTIDLSDRQPHASGEVSRLVQEFVHASLDRTAGAPFEAKFWKLTEDEHVLVLLIDGLFSDGISNGIINREILECCRQRMLGEIREALAYRNFHRLQELIPGCVATELRFYWRSPRLRGEALQSRPHPKQAIKRQPVLERARVVNSNFWCIFNEAPSDVCVTMGHQPNSVSTQLIQKLERDLRSISNSPVEKSGYPIDHGLARMRDV